MSNSTKLKNIRVLAIAMIMANILVCISKTGTWLFSYLPTETITKIYRTGRLPFYQFCFQIYT